MYRQKVIKKQDFMEIRKQLKSQNKKIVLCHGVFDLIHPGHIEHFNEAKRMGDVLVVSVTASKYVRKGPGRPYFDDRLRLQSLAALEDIDYVILSEDYTVENIVEVVQPDLYVKGGEYKVAEDDVTGKITQEIETVRKYGGDVYFTNGEVFSSTKLINKAFPVFSDEVKVYLEQFKRKANISDMQQYVSKMENLKVLVIGDIIIDNYVFCKVQGLMSKNNGYSARYIKEEMYLGGSMAIARHLSEFCNNVTLMSVMGCEQNILKDIEEFQEKIHLNLIQDKSVSTTIKKRYVEPDQKRKELNKIFVINNLQENVQLDEGVMSCFRRKLENEIPKYDVVFLCDFGHGLIDEKVADIIQNKAKKLILNCQTNSSNYGLNLITKYRRADYFSLDEKELRLAFGSYNKKMESLLIQLAEHLQGKGWLTRGSKGAMGVECEKLSHCPALVLDVLDTIGAGDAFFSLAGLTVAVGATVEEGAFMGNVAGALATNIMGNSESLSKVDTLKYIFTLLKE